MSSNQRPGALAQWAAPEGSDDLSGMRLLSDGLEAFETRAHLLRHAEHSFDALLYLCEYGVTTRVLVAEIIAAAERGVRVRLVVDDLSAIEVQKMLLALQTHPNIDIRLYNPILFWRRYQWSHRLAMLLTLARAHRRMHNKLWLVDGQVGIVGGRNMSDDYFIVDSQYNFADLDMLVAGGACAEQMKECFSGYWNGCCVRTLESIMASDAHYQWQQLRDELTELLSDEQLADSPFLPIHLGESRGVAEGFGELVRARGELLWDHPDKAGERGYPPVEMSLISQLGPVINETREHIRIVSAYFIPSEREVIDLEALVGRGVKLTVLTNSLNANDAPIVTGAWAPWRTRMVDLGVQVHELREGHKPKRHRAYHFGAMASSLHGKAMVMDDERLFIGSFNFDPRSIWWNNEMGLLVHHEGLTAQLRAIIERAQEPASSFRVERDGDSGSLVWVTTDESHREQRFRREPGSWSARVQKWAGGLPLLRRLL